MDPVVIRVYVRRDLVFKDLPDEILRLCNNTGSLHARHAAKIIPNFQFRPFWSPPTLLPSMLRTDFLTVYDIRFPAHRVHLGNSQPSLAALPDVQPHISGGLMTVMELAGTTDCILLGAGTGKQEMMPVRPQILEVVVMTGQKNDVVEISCKRQQRFPEGFVFRIGQILRMPQYTPV